MAHTENGTHCTASPTVPQPLSRSVAGFSRNQLSNYFVKIDWYLIALILAELSMKQGLAEK